jgi:hypothetical protein
MNYWLFDLMAAGIVLLLLFRVNLYIDVRVLRQNEDDFIAITVSTLQKLFVYSLKIPAVKIIQDDVLPWLTTEIKTPKVTTETHIEREQRFAKKLLTLFVTNPRKFRHILRDATDFYNNYRFYTGKLLRGLHCEKFELKVVYGFEDAALTGVMMGVLGTITARMLTALQTQVCVETKPELTIKPLFGRSYFAMELTCIFRIRLGNVITASMATVSNSLHREAKRNG